jgi:hypothetical protein
MDDLVAFLRARCDEDEQVARAATDGPWSTWEGRELHGLGDLIHPVRTPGQMPGSRATIVTASWLDAEHIARHNPARVLRQVEAVRGVLFIYDQMAPGLNGSDAGTRGAARMALTVLQPVLGCLAQAYADHPDYRPEWAPVA